MQEKGNEDEYQGVAEVKEGKIEESVGNYHREVFELRESSRGLALS